MNNNYNPELEGDFFEVAEQDHVDMDYPGSSEEVLDLKLDYEADVYSEGKCCETKSEEPEILL